jgi:hypothetical protein
VRQCDSQNADIAAAAYRGYDRFTGFLWSVVFMRHQELPLFDGQKIKLFNVMLG